MAKQHLSYSPYLDAKCLRPIGQHPPKFRPQLLRCPSHGLAPLFRSGAVPLRLDAHHLRKHLPVAVAAEELHGNVQVQQIPDGFLRHRPRKHVPPDHNLVNCRLANILEHGLKCGKVRMKVINRSDPHIWSPALSRITKSSTTRAFAAFAKVVHGANDAPDAETQLIQGLYAAHLALLLIWSQDQSPDSQSTHAALEMVSKLTARVCRFRWRIGSGSRD